MGKYNKNQMKSEMEEEGPGWMRVFLFWIQGTVTQRLTQEEEARRRHLDGLNSTREFLQLLSS